MHVFKIASDAHVKKYARERHYRVLVAALHRAPWFVVDVTWMIVDTLQVWGALVPGTMTLTPEGELLIERMRLDPQHAAQLDAAEQELQRRAGARAIATR